MTDNSLIEKIASIDWEFSDADTQYLTHNIHRYSGKFIPQIAQKAIQLLTNPGDTILDSYMGSGTTLLEAQLSNRNAIGIDLNPLAVLISQVKNLRISENGFNDISTILIPYVSDLSSNGQLSFTSQTTHDDLIQDQFSKNTWRLTDDWNRKWYQPAVLEQLVKIYSCIEILPSECAKQIAQVAFSDVLRKSSNASSKYPNVMYDKNHKEKPLPAKSFLENIYSIMSCLNELAGATADKNVDIQILQGNNLDLPLPNESVDAIITHPPYIAAVPYAEYGCLSLNWLGHDSKTLDAELTGGKRHSSKVVDNFSADYEQYFLESYRVLKPSKYMFIMVGNPVSHGKKIPLDQMSIEFAQRAGFKHITTAIRKGQNRRGNKMGEEYLIFFQKQ
ncbi:DNA methyltransferase [Phascolarctobacterium faecium]|jgi:methylase of polypeptide subunit release factors|uniref:DNA methyltransferase n=1 Tax=Phascolarctobacterium faecium TaxID=33025 RepID=UPI0026DAB251|nr:DNA methyltransferase [Phascolarctobacterium faecium]